MAISLSYWSKDS